MLREGHVDEKFVKMLLENLYVHDNVNGVQTVLDGYHFYKTSKWLLKSGGGWAAKVVPEQYRINEYDQTGRTIEYIGY